MHIKIGPKCYRESKWNNYPTTWPLPNIPDFPCISLYKNEYCFKQYSQFILVGLASVFVFQPLVSTCNLLKRYRFF